MLGIIDNDRDLYRAYKTTLLEQPSVFVSVDGDDFTYEEQQQISGTLQELVTAEIIRLDYDRFRARGVADRFLDESDLRSSLEGSPLPAREQRVLEAKVRLLASRMRQPQDGGGGPDIDVGDGVEPPRGRPPSSRPDTQTISQASHQFGHTCICVSNSVPGQVLSLAGLSPLPAPPVGQNFITVIVIVPIVYPRGPRLISDTLRLRVEPGGPFGISAGNMQVGLASEVDWAKEIVAWHLCRGRLASVYQPGPNTTPNYMLLTKGCDGPHTIIFRKPGFLGFWLDVACFEPALFWNVFDGRRLTFTWIQD